jgi:alginate O-acetyltransferase complex protein AlgI
VLFPTLEFAIFFALVLPATWALNRHPRAWRWLLLVASYVFYGWWDWRFLGLIGASTVVNRWLGAALHRAEDPKRRLRLVQAAAAVNLGTLGFFKYYGFFVLSLEGALRGLGLEVSLPLLEIVLPVGISFFTFQAMSYVIDIYRRQLAPAPLLDFAVYLALFPQLVAGPIVRASELLPQFNEDRDPDAIPTGRAFRLIAGGLLKKVVIADVLARSIVDPVFATPALYEGPEILLGVYGYAVQIYCDFSAYSDIAIGVALLMGLRFPDNFDDPYRARSLQDFWRRWHMTLSRWLRDYLYISLGGNRGGRLKTYRNLALTMLLGGLWHGASWMFVIWGALHGGYLALERWLGEQGWYRAGRGEGALVPWLERLWIFHLVCLAWIFFRAQSMDAVGDILGGLARGWDHLPTAAPAVYLAIAAGMAVQFLPEDLLPRLDAALGRAPAVAQGLVLAALLLLIDGLAPPGVAAFIYFQF